MTHNEEVEVTPCLFPVTSNDGIDAANPRLAIVKSSGKPIVVVELAQTTPEIENEG